MASDLPFYNISVPQKLLFWKFLKMILHAIGGLPPPTVKIQAKRMFETFLTFIFVGDRTGYATESRLPEYKQKLHFISY